MPDPHHKAKKDCDQETAGTAKKHKPQNRKQGHDNEGDLARPRMYFLTEGGVYCMTAVKLARGYQVQPGYEQTDPGGKVERIPDTEGQVFSDRKSVV